MSLQTKQSSFLPDSRNLGGRKYVVEQHFNHRNSLANIKSVVNIQQILCNPPPTKGSNLNKPLYKKISEFHEVYETFRRVACVKQGISNSLQPPETFHMIRPVQKIKQKNKAELQIDYQHDLNCNAMIRNIDEINNNPSSFEKLIGGTSYSFFRPQSTKNAFKSQQHFHSQYNLQKQKKIQPKKKQIQKINLKKPKQNKYKNIKFNDQDDQTYLSEEEQLWKEIFDNVPINEELNEESLAETKADIVDVILNFRLYKESDFDNLQQLVQFKNSHIDVEILDSIFQEIKDAFNE